MNMLLKYFRIRPMVIRKGSILRAFLNFDEDDNTFYLKNSQLGIKIEYPISLEAIIYDSNDNIKGNYSYKFTRINKNNQFFIDLDTDDLEEGSYDIFINSFEEKMQVPEQLTVLNSDKYENNAQILADESFLSSNILRGSKEIIQYAEKVILDNLEYNHFIHEFDCSNVIHRFVSEELGDEISISSDPLMWAISGILEAVNYIGSNGITDIIFNMYFDNPTSGLLTLDADFAAEKTFDDKSKMKIFYDAKANLEALNILGTIKDFNVKLEELDSEEENWDPEKERVNIQLQFNYKKI